MERTYFNLPDLNYMILGRKTVCDSFVKSVSLNSRLRLAAPYHLFSLLSHESFKLNSEGAVDLFSLRELKLDVLTFPYSNVL